MKTVINIIGGTGAGKSTLGVALLGRDAEEEKIQYVTVNGKEEKVKWVYFPGTRSVVIGSAGSGTDAAGSLHGTTRLMPAFLADRKVDRILVNPCRCSRTWNVEMFQSLPGVRIVFVFFDLSLEGNLARIGKRRARVKNWAMTEKERDNVVQFHKRAKMVGEYAASKLRPQDVLVRLSDKDSFAAGVRKVKAVL